MVTPTPRGMYVAIIEDETQTFPWQPEVPGQGGQLYESKFELRIVPDEVQKQFVADNTTETRKRGGRIEKNFDITGYNDDCINYAVVSWEKVRTAPMRGKPSREIPCERAAKLKLPDRFKSDILRLCVSREAGEMLEQLEDEGDQKNA